jgi:hypothetical protein
MLALSTRTWWTQKMVLPNQGGMLRRLLFIALLLGTYTLHAQSPAEAAANEGIWEGYDGEWR